MSKLSHLKRRNKKKYKDPAVDQLAKLNASHMFFGTLFGLGWRLSIMVLLPIFVGVQIDKKLDSSPSVTLSAFFIAVFAASLFIYRTYSEMNKEVEAELAKNREKKRQKLKRLLLRKKRQNQVLTEDDNV